MADTVCFKHQHIMMPTYTMVDAILVASKERTQVLQHDATSNIGQTGEEKLTALANIFSKVATTMTTQEE